MRCEHCGHEQAQGRFCDNCGRMLTRIRLEPEDTETASPQRPAPPQVRCSHCGHQQAGGRLCAQCGMQLDYYSAADDGEPQMMVCPECGVHTTRVVCPNCSIRIPVPEEE